MKSNVRVQAFRNAVWKQYYAHGRHDLPWRKTKDPYKILVSEVMLQQTQVSRVLEKYKEFLAAFPTVQALAQAPLADVLRVWSGMGYNRRAKYLREAANVIVEQYGGRVPNAAATLRSVPGVGPYTASAVLIFAFNVPDTMIETNIRAAYIHHFFPPPLDKEGQHNDYSKFTNCVNRGRLTRVGYGVNDRDLLPLITKAAEGQDPRTWHWALMDYGAHLKKLHPNPSRRSVHHVKQSKFEGSLRQVRGAILRELRAGASNLTKMPYDKEKIQKAAAGLECDGMIRKIKGRWRIA